ncbi:M15 family metallopeptidase [Bacillus sp. 3103sda1]|uniref:M15 family metallopeptidase n=1 Tax=Bacillus sp. 3103sda1 TaxID=2953808 RepID=UPI00281660B8|nr:M15 family metallopeptidase [Bacillus sp. 3103sda1]
MKYHNRNVNNLNKLADHTKAAAFQWYHYCVDKGIEVLIYETIRTIEQQRQNVAKGASQTMRSYHLVGQALDFVPIKPDGTEDWDGYRKEPWASAIRYAKNIGFEWGGDWKGFVDSPHLQWNYKGYGTDTFNVGAVADCEPVNSNERGTIDLPSDWQTKNLGYITVTVDVANVREKPSTDSAIKGKVRRGSGHVYLDWYYDGVYFWYKIANHNWLRSDVCQINKDNKWCGVIWVDGSNVNVRSGSGTQHAKVDKINQGSYEIDGREGDWVHIKDRGWIYFDASYVKWIR